MAFGECALSRGRRISVRVPFYNLLADSPDANLLGESDQGNLKSMNEGIDILLVVEDRRVQRAVLTQSLGKERTDSSLNKQI